ncbi:nitroreductase family protein [Acetobacterium woodii]|uniref:Nitroreductase family protein n=1 Tax=Acetobacterium woodii (strain ATCC 29683 / DSM 1030 / JCM 2381 / KCTC 1655 / WB1) TaxID=931626 RepID=H6LJ47_ACEWD|nr:nitroreductase family protein [Acetobacterium woodii]AFA47410.1 nitroreductase family protein [Acetobacterium woodii DSM 1030]
MNNIFKRKSVRKYLDKPVEQEKIEIMLKAGMQAPSAANQQPWEFLVVTDREKLEKLSNMSPYAKPLAKAGLAIILIGNLTKAVFPGTWEQDLGAASENILLEAVDLGLSGVWLGVAPEQDRMDFITKQFSLPTELKPFSVLSIGYPDEAEPTLVERYDPTRVHYNHY